MSTSIGDLLASAEHEIRSLGDANARTSAACLATLAPAARALTVLAPAAADRTGRAMLLDLATACSNLASAWPPVDSAPAALVGAAADLIAIKPPTSTESAWAVCVAIGDVALTTIDHAIGFSPIAEHELLTRAQVAVTGLHRAAAMNPPTSRGALVLDDLVPNPAGLESTSRIERATEGIVTLFGAAHRRAIAGRLTVAEFLACASAAEAAAHVTTDLLKAELDEKRHHRSAVSVWRAVQNTCGPFDDGTKNRPPDPSAVLTNARLVTTSLAAWMPRDTTSVSDAPALTAADHAHLTVMANQLPKLAESMEGTVDRWARTRQLVAPERSLASFEFRNTVAAPNATRIVRVDPSDVDELRSTLRDARVLTTAFAAAINSAPTTKRHSGFQPRLAADYAAAALDEQRGLSTRAARADRISHRATEQWSMPARSQRAQRPQR